MNLKKMLFSPLFVLAVSLAGLSVGAYQFGGGSVNTDEERNQIKIQVYNTDNVAHEVGDVLVWKDGSISDGVEVSSTTTANNSLVAGVVVDNTIAATSWGWIQTSGYHGSITVTGTVTAGDLLTTSTTGEAGRTYTVVDSTGSIAGEGDDFGVYGVALTSDSGGTVKGFIRLN